MSTYASFQGRVFLGKRDIDGLPIEVRSPGNVAELKLSLKTDVLEHYESQTGQRSLDHRMVKQKSAAVNLTIETTRTLKALGAFDNLPEIKSKNPQLYKDIVGDSSHAVRGLNLALGRGAAVL